MPGATCSTLADLSMPLSTESYDRAVSAIIKYYIEQSINPDLDSLETETFSHCAECLMEAVQKIKDVHFDHSILLFSENPVWKNPENGNPMQSS